MVTPTFIFTEPPGIEIEHYNEPLVLPGDGEIREHRFFQSDEACVIEIGQPSNETLSFDF